MRNPYYQDDAVTIYHGDCREILPEIGPVDLVLNNGLKNSTVSDSGLEYEALRNGEEMAGEEGRDRMALPQSELVTGADGVLLQYFTNGYDESVEAARNQIPWPGQDGRAKRTVQRRYTEHILSFDDSERQVREMRSRREISYSSQERRPSGQSSRESSDSLRELPQQLPSETVVAITDPPSLDPFMGSGTTLRAAKDLGRSQYRLRATHGS